MEDLTNIENQDTLYKEKKGGQWQLRVDMEDWQFEEFDNWQAMQK